jgi:hypothetical protein
MNWKNYEEIVSTIYEKIGSQSGVRIICSGSDCKVTGKSGVEHQIDVLTEHSDGLHLYRTAIECKYRDKKRPKDDVMKLSVILEDAGIHKGVIVSKSGFTPDAISTARTRNIELVELREPTDKDWKGRIKDIYINAHITLPIPYDFRLDFIASEATLPQSSEGIDPSTLVIRKPGVPDVNLKDLIQEMISGADYSITEPQLLRRVFPEGTTTGPIFGRSSHQVAAIQFQLRIEHHTSTSILTGADHVAMIMKSIFDNKRLIISREGEIRESEA